MKILLISLQDNLDTIGLKYLHSSLLHNGYDSSILYLPTFSKEINNKSYLKRIDDFVISFDPAFIGISLMSIKYFESCAITKFLKKGLPLVPIIWGGIHPTICPEECLQYADYVCIGEGEETIIKIAEAIANQKELKHVNNLMYRVNGKIKKNPLSPLIDNLDKVPACEHVPPQSFILTRGRVAALEHKTFVKYARFGGRLYSIMASRGCPYSCGYCCNNFLLKLYGAAKIRRRSPDNIVEELAYACQKNPQVEIIDFQDDCFMSNTEEYLEKFTVEYARKVKRPFIVRSIPVSVTREKVRILKRAGLCWMIMGLQSGSDHVCRDIYNRKSLREDFLNAAKIVNEEKIAAFYDVITDNVFEREEDILMTADALIDTPKPFYIEFFSLAMYPGTQLYEKAKTASLEKIEDCRKKHYLVVKKNDINVLLRIASYFNPRGSRKLMGLYRMDKKCFRLKLALNICNLLNNIFFEPAAYFSVIRISQRGSFIRTLKAIVIYSKEGLSRYLHRF